MEVKREIVESPVDMTPNKDEVPTPPAFVTKKFDVFEVKSATVESPVEKSWRIFLAKLEVLDVKRETVERGVDQFWRVFWK